MTGFALWQEPLRALGIGRLGKWALKASDRRGQDKAPKVRAVVWGPEYLRIPVVLQTLRNAPRNLRFSTTRYCRSAFDTL
jgi:hypothetical protein